MYLFLKIYELYFHYNTVLLSDLLDIYEYKVLKYLQICWHMPVIITPKKWRQENRRFEARLGYITSLRQMWAIQ